MKFLKIIFTDLNEKDICSYKDEDVNIGDTIIVNTSKGKRVAEVLDKLDELVDFFSVDNILFKIVDNEDWKVIKKNSKLSKNALSIARKYADSLNLNIGFVSSEYTYDKRQLIFLFVADTRVDFRELAKKLAQKYKTRIELRQIGVRDKARMIGGLGPCGLPLCCNNFLSNLNSVSINMAKNQMLALNPSKINGVCGRLLCCLQYEDDFYFEMRTNNPSVGDLVEYSGEKCKVIECNYLNMSFKIQKRDGEFVYLDMRDFL